MASNSITNYLKNITKSVKFAAIESVSEKTPNIQKLFSNNNKKYVQEVYKDVSQNKQKMNMVERIRNATVFRQISTGWDNLKDSIKTGKFYDENRSSGVDEMEVLMGMLGDDIGGDFDMIEAEMNGEEVGSTNDHRVHGVPEVTRGDALVATASARATGRAAKTISKAIVRASELSDLTTRKSVNLQLRALQEHANILSTGFQDLSSSLHAINQFNNQVVLTNAQNSRLFYEQATQLAQERNAILREMLEMQRQTFNATIKSKDQSQDFSDFKRIFDKDKGFDLRAYGNLMQKRMKETPIGQMMMFIKMLPMAIGDVVQNPLHHIAKMGIDSIIDNGLKKAIANIDKSITGYLSTAFTKLYNYGHDATTKNSILGKIAGFFGIKNENTRLSAVDTSKYNKEAMQWNGIAQKALVEVIPGHLRRIEAALTGEGERTYDFQGGKWSTMKRVATQERELNDKIFKQIFSKTKNNILNNMNLDRDQLRGWNNALDDFFRGVQERGMVDYQHINKYRNKYGKNENVVKAIELMLHSGFIDPSEIANLTTKINQGHAKKAEIIKNLNPSNQSLYNEVMNNSYNKKWAYGTGATFNEKGKQTGVDSEGRFLSRPINDLTKLIDSRGYTLYDYQYQILQTLRNMGTIGNGNGSNIITPPSTIISGNAILGTDGKVLNNSSTKSNQTTQRSSHVQSIIQNARTKSAIKRSIQHPDYSGVSEDEKFFYDVDTIANATPEQLAQLIPIITEIGHIGKTNRYKSKTVNNTGILSEAKSMLGGLGLKETDSFLEGMTEAVTIADKFNVVGQALKSLTSAPQSILTSVFTEADKFIYNFMFGNPAGTEKDENGQPIEGFFGKVTNEFGKTMDNLNNKFNEWFKDTFKEGAKGLSGLIKNFAQDYLGIDIDEKVKNARRKVNKYTNKIKKGLYGVGAELFGVAKDSVLGTAQDLGLYEPDEEDAKPGKPTTAYRGISKYPSKYGIGVVGPGEKIISPGRGKVINNTTGYKAYALQYGDSVIPSYLNPSNAGRGRVTPQSLASQEYNEQALAKNISRGNMPVLGTFSGLGWIDDLKAQENKKDTTPKLGNKAKAKSRGTFSKLIDLMMGYDRPEFTEDQIKMQDFIYNIVNSATKAAIEANGGAFEDENQKGRSITQAGFEMAGKLRKSNVNLNSKEFQEALEEVLAMKENIKDPDFRDTLRFILETAGYQGNFATEDESKQKRRSRRRGIFTGVNQFMTAAFGIDVDKAVKTADKEIRKNLPELAKGGTLGLLASTVLPLGGPLMGAIVGAGASILTKNKSFQEYVFGKEITDDKGNVVGRDNSGLVSQKTVKTIQKYLPDAKKYGITGALAGLILPFGPLGGMMIGAGASILKNNQSFQDFMFGEKGGLINKDRKERIKRALPQIGAATLGTMFFGPFGLMGNAIVGAGLGILSTTESFKRIMLGSKDKNGIRRGGLADVIRRQITEPFKSTMQDVSKRLASWFKDDIFNPIARTVKPLGRNIAGEVKNLARAAADKIFGTGQKNGFIGRLGLKSVDRLLTGVRKAGGLGKWVAGGIGGALGTVAHGLENQVGKRLERRAFRKGFFESGTTSEERKARAEELGIDINDASQYALGGLDQLMAKIKQGPNAQEGLEELSAAISLIQANNNGTKNDINSRIRGEQDNMRSMSEKAYQDYLKKNPNEKNPHDLHRKLESVQKEMTRLANMDDFDPNAAKGTFGEILKKSGLPVEMQEQILDAFLQSGASIKKYQDSLNHFGDNTYAKDIFAKKMGYKDYESADNQIKKQIDTIINHAESQAAVDNEIHIMKDNQKNDESTNEKLKEQLTDAGDKLITNNQEIEINELKIMNTTLETISRILSTNDTEEKKKFLDEFNTRMEKYNGSTNSTKVTNAIEDAKKYVAEKSAQKEESDMKADIAAGGLKRMHENDTQRYDKDIAEKNQEFKKIYENDQVIKNIEYTYQQMMDGKDEETRASLEKEMEEKIEGRKQSLWDQMNGNTTIGALKHDARVIKKAVGKTAGKVAKKATKVAKNAGRSIGNTVSDIANSEAVRDNLNPKSMYEMGKDIGSGLLSMIKDFFINVTHRSDNDSIDPYMMDIAKNVSPNKNDNNPPTTATYGLPFYGNFTAGTVLAGAGQLLRSAAGGAAKSLGKQTLGFGANLALSAIGLPGLAPKATSAITNGISNIHDKYSNINANDIKSTIGALSEKSGGGGTAPDLNKKDNISYTTDGEGNPIALQLGQDGTPMKVRNKDNAQIEAKHQKEFELKERSTIALEAIAAKIGANVSVEGKPQKEESLFDKLLSLLGMGLPLLAKLPGLLLKGLKNLLPAGIAAFGKRIFNGFKNLGKKLFSGIKKIGSTIGSIGKKIFGGFKNLGKSVLKMILRSRIGKAAALVGSIASFLGLGGGNDNNNNDNDDGKNDKEEKGFFGSVKSFFSGLFGNDDKKGKDSKSDNSKNDKENKEDDSFFDFNDDGDKKENNKEKDQDDDKEDSNFGLVKDVGSSLVGREIAKKAGFKSAGGRAAGSSIARIIANGGEADVGDVALFGVEYGAEKLGDKIFGKETTTPKKFSTGTETAKNAAEYGGKKAASESAKAAAEAAKAESNGAIQMAIGKIKSTLQNVVSSVGKWFPGEAAGKALNSFCKSIMEKVMSPPGLKAIGKAIAKQSAAASTGAATLGIGYVAVAAGFVVYQFIHGFNNAAEMFKVNEAVVTNGMKVISGLMCAIHSALTSIPVVGIAIAVFIHPDQMLEKAIDLIGPAVGLSREELNKLRKDGDKKVEEDKKAVVESSNLGTTFEKAIKSAGNSTVGLITQGAATFAGIVSDKAKDAMKTIGTATGKAFDFVSNTAAGVGKFVSDNASKGYKFLSDTASSAWKAAKSFGSKVYDGISGAVKSGASWIKDKWNSFSFFGKGKTPKYGGYEPIYGMGGIHSQLNPEIANERFNIAGDTEVQTVRDSACGPMAMANAMEKVGVHVDDKDILEKTKYGKEKNGGMPDYVLSEYANKKGLSTRNINTSAKDIAKSLMSGNSLVLMGQNNAGETDKDPYAENPHYVTATNIDDKGNVTVQDPESEVPTKIYNLNDLVKTTSLATEVGGFGKGKRSIFGRYKYGRAKIEDDPYANYDVKKNSGITAEKLNEAFKGGILEGKGQAFIDAGNKYKIDPAFLAAITFAENGFGKNKSGILGSEEGKYNVFSMMDGRVYKSVEENLDRAAKNLAENYVYDSSNVRDTVYKIHMKYCPPGAANDPKGTNGGWTHAVGEGLKTLGISPNGGSGSFDTKSPSSGNNNAGKSISGFLKAVSDSSKIIKERIKEGSKRLLYGKGKHGRSKWGKGEDVPEKIWNFLNPKLGSVATAAIMGNIEAESSYNPKDINSSSGAAGLCQWLDDRKTRMMEHAKKMNKPWDTVEPQMSYLWEEMDDVWKGKTFKQWAKEINAAGDPGEGAIKWENLFERSGHTASFPRRRKSAIEAFQKQGKGIKTDGNSYDSPSKNPNNSKNNKEEGIFGALSQLMRKVGSIIDIFGSDDSNGSNNSPGGPNAEEAAKKIVAKALEYEKSQIHYQLGGTDQPGNGYCDCSGMCMNCYKAANIDITRTAESQYNFFKSKNALGGNDIKKMQAGDLVFTKGSNGIDHVFVYIGNAKAVNLGSTQSKGSGGGNARIYDGWEKIQSGINYHSGGLAGIGSLSKLCSALGITSSGDGYDGGEKRSSTNRIIIHHTGSGAATSDQSAEEINKYHKEHNGWNCIGYHYVIRKSGNIEKGRKEDRVGAHAEGANSDSIGIHVSGEFQNENPTDKQIESLVKLLQQLCKKYNIPIDRKHIIGHREVCSTDCPGNNLYNKLDSIVSRAAGGRGKFNRFTKGPVSNPTSKFGKGKHSTKTNPKSRTNSKSRFGKGLGLWWKLTGQDNPNQKNESSGTFGSPYTERKAIKPLDYGLFTPEEVEIRGRAKDLGVDIDKYNSKKDIEGLKEIIKAKETGQPLKLASPPSIINPDKTLDEINNENQQQQEDDTSLMDKFFSGTSEKLKEIEDRINPIKTAIREKLGSTISEKFGKFSDVIGNPLKLFSGLFSSGSNNNNDNSNKNFDGDSTPMGKSGSAAAALKKALNCEITSDFGPRGSGMHNGIDYGIGVGTPVPSVTDGTIDDIGSQGGGYGKFVVVKDKKNRYHIYAHLSQNDLAKKGDSVKAGHIIAKSGNTGHSTGPHLHYGIYDNPNCAAGNGVINPNKYDITGLNSSNDGKGKYGRGKKIIIHPVKTKGTDSGGINVETPYQDIFGRGKEATIYEDLEISKTMDPIENIPQELKSSDHNFGINNKPLFGKGKYGRGFKNLINSFKDVYKIYKDTKNQVKQNKNKNPFDINPLDPKFIPGGGFGGAINKQMEAKKKKEANNIKTKANETKKSSKLIAPNGKEYSQNDIDYILKNSAAFGGAKTVEDAIKILEKHETYAKKDDKSTNNKNNNTKDDKKKKEEEKSAIEQKQQEVLKAYKQRMESFNEIPDSQKRMMAQLGLIPKMPDLNAIAKSVKDSNKKDDNKKEENKNIGENRDKSKYGPNGKEYSQNDIDYILKNSAAFGGAKTREDAIKILEKSDVYTKPIPKTNTTNITTTKNNTNNKLPILTSGGGFGGALNNNRNNQIAKFNTLGNLFGKAGGILGNIVGTFSSKEGSSVNNSFSNVGKTIGTIGGVIGSFGLLKDTFGDIFGHKKTENQKKIKNLEKRIKAINKSNDPNEIKKLIEDIPKTEVPKEFVINDEDSIDIIKTKAINTIKAYIEKLKAEDAKKKKEKEEKKNIKKTADNKKAETKAKEIKDNNSITKAQAEAKFGLGPEGSHGKGPNGKPYTNNDIIYILKNPTAFGGAKTIEDAIKILEKDKKYTEEVKKENKTKSETGTQANSETAKTKKNENKQGTVTTDTHKASKKASEAKMSTEDKLDALLAAQNKTNELLSAILNLAIKKLDVKDVSKPTKKNVNTGEPVPRNATEARSQLNYFYNNSMKNSGVDMSFFNPDSGDPIDITKRMQSIASM